MQAHIVKSFDTQIQGLKDNVTQMAIACEAQIETATQVFIQMDISLAQEIIKADERINRFQREIEREAVQFLARRQPMAVDLRLPLSAIKIASELERIGDYTANIAKRVIKLSRKPVPEQAERIIKMADISRAMLHDAVNAFLELNIQKAVEIWKKDEEIDHHFSRLMEMLRNQMQDQTHPIEDCTQMIFMGRCLERIGDHITNIAENIYYAATGQTYISQFSDQ
jgi:phosphate transport system protein